MRLPRPPGNDELAELGDTLNEMLRRIHTTMQHERAFIDDASHELRTPIAVLRGELELARLDLGDGEGADQLAAALDSALEETDRLARLADNLLVLARADAGQLVEGRTRFDLAELVRAVVAATPAGEVAVEIRAGAPVELEADPSTLERVVQNLLSNAARHAASRVRMTVTADKDAAVLSVADDGPGFDDELLRRAFDRFVRSGTRSRIEGGAGLGLAIVAASAEAMGGTVRAANGRPLGGARVTVRIPRTSAAHV
jgi:signal transduction histidine kinase